MALRSDQALLLTLMLLMVEATDILPWTVTQPQVCLLAHVSARPHMHLHQWRTCAVGVNQETLLMAVLLAAAAEILLHRTVLSSQALLSAHAFASQQKMSVANADQALMLLSEMLLVVAGEAPGPQRVLHPARVEEAGWLAAALR